MINDKNLHSWMDSEKHPCGIYWKGVGSNSIFCAGKSYGYIRNAVASKVNQQLILHISVKDATVFAEQLMGDLKSI